MTHRSRCLIPALLIAAFAVVDVADAQRGRRRSEAIRSRVGVYFVDTVLPTSVEDRLAEAKPVKAAAEKGQMSVLYLFDPGQDERKHKQFEQVMFNHDALGVALRCFQCARVDLTSDVDAHAEFGKKAPLFVVFDASGKRVGETALPGYKAATSALTRVLSRAASGYGKWPLTSFVKKYRAFLNDYTLLEGRKRGLGDKRKRAEKKSGRARENKLIELAKEEKELDQAERDLLAHEQELLKEARVPPRDPKAKRAGDRERGR